MPDLRDRAPLSESERLRLKVELVLPALRRAAARFLDHPRIGTLYPEYLFASHCVVRASVPLMETALAESDRATGRDPVAAGLVRYLGAHIEEERHHDEWLLEDLERVGMDRSAVLNRPPSAAVAALVGAQYYWIHHYHPVALMGYIAVLEGTPPSLGTIDRLAAKTGYGREAFRTLEEHAELDPRHVERLNETLDRLPLDREQSAVLGVSALHTVVMLARVLDGIVDGEADAEASDPAPESRWAREG